MGLVLIRSPSNNCVGSVSFSIKARAIVVFPADGTPVSQTVFAFIQVLNKQMRIRLRDLRKIIHEELTISSTDEIAREIPPWQRESLEMAMQHFGLKIIPSSRAPAGYMGAGAYGAVYEVLHNGKQRALKITTDEDDADAYRTWMGIQKSVPTFARTAMPVVYDQYYQDGVWMTLMEYLAPLPKSLRFSAFDSTDHEGGAVTLQTRINATKKFIENLDTLLYRLLGQPHRNFSLSQNDRKKIADAVVSSDEWKQLKDLLKGKKGEHGYVLSNFEPEEHSYMFSEAITNALAGLKLDASAKKLDSFIWKVVLNLTSEWMEYLPPMTMFPSYGGASEKKQQFEDPKVKKLYHALRWLDQHDYIEGWSDVHSGNVLVRPSTGDIVVADIGLFSF